MSLRAPSRPAVEESAPPGTSNGRGVASPGGRRRRIGAVLPYAFVGALIAAALAGYFLVLERESDVEPATSAVVETGSSEIARRDLRVQDTFSGTLTYASASTVRSSGGGTVTSLPAEGDVRVPGDVLYAVDGRPILALEGEISMWRSLGIGLETTPVVNQLAGDGHGDRAHRLARPPGRRSSIASTPSRWSRSREAFPPIERSSTASRTGATCSSSRRISLLSGTTPTPA